MRARHTLTSLIRRVLTVGWLGWLLYRLARAVNPCEEVQGKRPPVGDPNPTIGGTVTDAASGAGIENATLEVFQCNEQSGAATSEGTTTTNSSGDYTFTDLAPGYYYYVAAHMTGPLSGMEPTSGTSNPSDPVGLGDSVSDLDFVFQDA